MRAREAHQLRVGQFVVTSYGTSHRKGQINKIEWPHFVVTSTLENGKDRQVRRQYRSIHSIEDYTRQYGPPRG